jgi:hypothetical protein
MSYRFFKCPRTHQEMRMASDPEHKDYVRAARRKLPNDWDDLSRHIERSWKFNRKQQHRNLLGHMPPVEHFEEDYAFYYEELANRKFENLLALLAEVEYKHMAAQFGMTSAELQRWENLERDFICNFPDDDFYEEIWGYRKSW